MFFCPKWLDLFSERKFRNFFWIMILPYNSHSKTFCQITKLFCDITKPLAKVADFANKKNNSPLFEASYLNILKNQEYYDLYAFNLFSK